MFKAGDRVHHIGRKESGTVLPFDAAGVVRVEFDNPTPTGSKSIGEFDGGWFASHPGWLMPLVSVPVGDENRFRYFAPDPPASIPEGTVGHLDLRTAAEIMAERRAWLDSTKVCECCAGKGRVPLDTP